MSSSHVDTAGYQTETYNDEEDSFEVASDFFSNGTTSEGSSDDDSIEAENKNAEDETADLLSVARRDTAHVRRWRMVVLTMIVVTGAVLTTGTYLVLRNEQFDDSIERVSTGHSARRDRSQYSCSLLIVPSIHRKWEAAAISCLRYTE